jgi:hypothetical protein
MSPVPNAGTAAGTGGTAGKPGTPGVPNTAPGVTDSNDVPSASPRSTLPSTTDPRTGLPTTTPSTTTDGNIDPATGRPIRPGDPRLPGGRVESPTGSVPAPVPAPTR